MRSGAPRGSNTPGMQESAARRGNRASGLAEGTSVSAMSNLVLGIDFGGTGIKGALVDLEVGDFATDEFRIPTPADSTPENVGEVVQRIYDHFADRVGDDPVGITIPAIFSQGVVRSAANIDSSWLGVRAEEVLSKSLGRPVVMVNDADAAGYAEAKLGAARGADGLVLVTTLGTGIGSAIVYNGVLIPNTELGHLEIDGYDAEKRAAASIKTAEGLSYEEYLPRLERYYGAIEMLFSPDLLVVGGGISADHELFMPQLRTKLHTPIIPATLQNRAGIIGAALLAAERGGLAADASGE